MNFTIDDIEIFVITHNRTDYLKQSVESILHQTAGVKNITVLDNESTDNTEEIVLQFHDKGVSYIKTFGFLGNFNKAQEIASKKYVMLFHDDDILDSRYLELALKALNTHTNISFLTTRYTEFTDNNIPDFAPCIKTTHHLFTAQKEFAKHMYFIERIAYATAIYRTEDFKKTPLEYEKYNKFNDWPFMVKMADYGNAVLFEDPRLFYLRRHDKQDTWTSTNTPSLEQIINWDKCFYEAMNAGKMFSLINIFYKSKCLSFLIGKYNAFLSCEDKEKYTVNDLLKLANRLKLDLFGVKLIDSIFKIEFLRKKIYRRFRKSIILANRCESL